MPSRRFFLFSPLLFLFVVGCGSSYPRVPGEQGKATFVRASTAYAEGRYVDAHRDFNFYRRNFPASVHASEASYWEGMSLLSLHQLEEARQRFKETARTTPDRRFRGLALQGEARAFFLEGRLQEAESTYLQLRRSYSDETDGAEVLAALAEIRLKMDDRAGARTYISELRRRFPGHPYLSRFSVYKNKDTLFVVQAGAFTHLVTARRLQSRLREKGFASFVVTRGVRGVVMHIVQGGAFAERVKADALARKLREAGFQASVQ